MGDCLLEKTALNDDEESGEYEELLCLLINCMTNSTNIILQG